MASLMQTVQSEGAAAYLVCFSDWVGARREVHLTLHRGRIDY